MSTPKNRSISPFLVWMDLEMSGLNPLKDEILQIAALITNDALEVISEGIQLVIHHPSAVLAHMDPVVRELHTQSGLLEQVEESSLSTQEAEQHVLTWIRQWVEPQSAPLCGNSIHMDRFFLMVHMPMLCGHLHYRNIDVSSIKELARRWKPGLAEQVVKKGVHLAHDDILESIAELRHYRSHWLV